jgi:Nickel responsive protein SCO4226-like
LPNQSIAEAIEQRKEKEMALHKFIIERDIPKIGILEREQLRTAAATSNQTVRELGPDVQWVESYVAENKTFCVYLAADENLIRKHAELSGIPATKITRVLRMIDPTTENPNPEGD